MVQGLFKFFLICLIMMIASVSASKGLEFLTEECSVSGEPCMERNCCESLTCSEFRFCRE